MRILHYYWSPYNLNLGGGVSVYLKNILPNLGKFHDVDFLSCGYYHDPSIEECYVQELEKISHNNIKSYTVVNSPVMSPGHDAWQHVETYLEDEILKEVLKKFILSRGGYDIIHFHSFEGLTQKILTLKEFFPECKFIWSVHNYHTFCPQVNLWKREKECCTDYGDGAQCTNCIFSFNDQNSLRYRRSKDLNDVMEATSFSGKIKRVKNVLKRKYILRNIKINKGYRAQRSLEIYDREDLVFSTDIELIKGAALKYKKYRENNVKLVNKYFDKVLAVSDRVRQICVESMGLNSELVETQYIGTKFKQKSPKRHVVGDKSITIAYLGYTRIDKGFFFFKECLEKIPENLARSIKVVIASSIEDPQLVYNLEQLSTKFTGFTLYNGYNHHTIEDVLKTVDLGIVPVLWEDNLPQVSIEMKSFGIPVLASDRGGASEISSIKNRDKFTFKAGNVEDFWEKVRPLAENPQSLLDFWDEAPILINLDQHADRMLSLYDNLVKRG